MRKASVTLLIYAMCAVMLITAAVWLSVRSLGAADGVPRTAPASPDTLLSVGAPRSQLELRRMFSSMKKSYFENGRRIFEPLSEEYKAAVDLKKANGEILSLSVEEVLYLITDSVAVYESYDIVKLVGAEGADKLYPIKDLAHADEAYDAAAQKRVFDIVSLVKYRLEALSSADRFVGEIYIPTQRSGTERTFIITENEISYKPDATRSIVLYPTSSDAENCVVSVVCESKKLILASERALLDGAGYENARNITPDFWYERTDIRIFISGGRTVLADAEKNELYHLDGGARLLSAALYADTVYLTVSAGEGSALLKLQNGELSTVEEFDTLTAVFETDGGAEVYMAQRLESEKYMVVLSRLGEALETVK